MSFLHQYVSNPYPFLCQYAHLVLVTHHVEYFELEILDDRCQLFSDSFGYLLN